MPRLSYGYAWYSVPWYGERIIAICFYQTINSRTQPDGLIIRLWGVNTGDEIQTRNDMM